MNKKKQKKFNLESFAFWFIIVFFIIGLFMTSVIAHELVHMYDYRDLIEDSEWSISIFTIKEGMTLKDFFSYPFGQHTSIIRGLGNIEKAKRIDKYSEVKAYTLQITILTIGFIALFIVLNKRWKFYGRFLRWWNNYP